jgi:hypothetical protein
MVLFLNEYLGFVLGSLGVIGEVRDDDDGGCVPVVFGVECCNCAEECFPYSKF